MTERRLRIILLCVSALLVLGFVVLLWPSPPLYKVTVLPSRPGQNLIPYGMNDHGQVFGFTQSLDQGIHLFFWDRAKGMRDLSTMIGDYAGINNAGQIAGTMADPNGEQQAFLWDPNNGTRLLGITGETLLGADALNDLGQVVGTFVAYDGTLHAFFWDQRNGMKDLGLGRACAINNAGQIISDTEAGALLIDANTEAAGIRIPVSGPLSLNNNGCVVGYSSTSAAGQEIVMWHRGSSTAKSIHLAGPALRCPINDANQVLFMKTRPARFRVGRRTLLPYRVECYLYDPTRGLTSLDRYVRAGPKEYFRPVDLNNKGGILLNSRYRAVLLEPIPERWGNK